MNNSSLLDNKRLIIYSLRNILLLIVIIMNNSTKAQSQFSDSTIIHFLKRQNITFSSNNSIALLINGQEKFNDLFKAIEQARSSIHLEYFNFRNDSINKILIKKLSKKAKQGIEVRAIFDGFGNFSNNKPMTSKQLKLIRSQGIEIYEFKPI